MQIKNEAGTAQALRTSPIKSQSLDDLSAQAERIGAMVNQIRGEMLAPGSKKTPPMVGATQLAELCETTKGRIVYRTRQESDELPKGRIEGNRREWTMEEAMVWVREARANMLKPSAAAGVTISVANFKGGVAKTTTVVTLAQGLARKGHKVLVIDLDPQGSATTLFGILPDVDVELKDTANPLFLGETDSIMSAIKPTYWPGIDLVAANPQLFGAEFALPARQLSNREFEFWRCLDHGLDEARLTYDVILIDTAPALSYVTINALIAADGVLMPLPPSALDFASSAQFWDLFLDLCEQLFKNTQQTKVFEFIDILLSRVEANDSATSIVRSWIIEGYGDKVLPIEIPKTAVSSAAAAEFGTVYDVPRGTMGTKTYSRAKDAYDTLVSVIEEQVVAIWAKQLGEGAI